MAKTAARKKGDASERALTITAIVVVAAATLTAGAIFGITMAWRSITGRPEFMCQPSEGLVLDENQKKWIVVEAMKKDFLLTAPPRPKDQPSLLAASVSIFEPNLAERVAAAYLASPWVRRVVSVTKKFPNQLTVRLDLRTPYAAIKYGDKTACVSEDGVVLDSNIYKLTLDNTKALRPEVRIPAGTPAPEPRKKWDAAAVASGLDMLRTCRGELSKLPISLISIVPEESNPSVCMVWLTLGADPSDPAKGTLVQWGRAPNCPVSDFEASTLVKINSLVAVFASEQQNIMRFKQIDVRDPQQVRYEQ